MLIFFKKIKKNTCRYHYQNLDDMIYSSWDIEQNILKLVTLGHFLPFYPPKKTPNQNFEKWKKLLWYHHFTYVYQKSQYMMYGWFLRYGERQTEFFVILGDFLPFYQPPIPLISKKSKFWKKFKETPRDIILLYIHVYHKWRSYDIWFVR